MHFEALGLNEQLVRAVTELGFETPTSIQEKAIPVLLSGTTDFMGLAQTGTGKQPIRLLIATLSIRRNATRRH